MNKTLAFFETQEKEILHQLKHFEQVLLRLRYEGTVCRGKNIKAARQAATKLLKTLKKHRKFQEEIIFPYLLVHIPKHESVIQFLRCDHQVIRGSKEDLYRSLQKLSRRTSGLQDGKIQQLGMSLIYLVRHHVELERSSIHKAITNELKPDEKKEVGKKARNWLCRHIGDYALAANGRVMSVMFIVMIVLSIAFGTSALANEPEGYMSSEGFYLPLGDPERGKEAFKTLKCFTCHQVQTDLSLPQPVAKPAPVLARAGMIHNPGDFADAILSPSHRIVVDSGGEKEGELSRMGDFADTMTVRQFVDIIAYLMGQEEW